MKHTRISSTTRRLSAVLALVVASAAAASWQPAHGTRRTITINPQWFVPPIFSVPLHAAFGDIVCNKKPLASEEMTYTMNSFSATHAVQGTQALPGLPASLNMAGLSGPAGVFGSGTTVPAGQYTAVSLVMSNVITARGLITCNPGGGTRTWWTNGSASFSVPSPSDANAANAAPTQTTFTTGSSPISAGPFSVSFTVVANASTSLNITYNTNSGLQLMDIGSGNYKVVAGGITISLVTP
jgi:hypothetical protein